MATLLYRLGCTAFQRRWYVLLVWLVIFVGIGVASRTAGPLPPDNSSTPGIEAQAALDLAQQRFPGAITNINNATAKVVFVAPAGQRVTDAPDKAAIEGLVSQVKQGSNQVESASSPFLSRSVSPDGSTAYATVLYNTGANNLTDAAKNGLQAAVDQARSTGLTVDVGGPVLASQPDIGGFSEVAGVLLAALVLLITFGSLVAAGLPLLTAILGVGVSIFTIFTLGNALGLSSSSSTLASMLGLAVGIDYALFVVSRYREERANGHPAREAAGLAVGTAGSSVVFAGLTVIAALAGLAVVGIPTATKMGLSAAGAVAVAVLIALTLVPALLGFWPNVVLSRKVRKGRVVATSTGDNRGARWAVFVSRRPVFVVLGAVVVLVLLALPVLHLQLGMPGDESKSTATTERRAYDELSKGFGPGFNGPLTIVVDARGSADPAQAARTIAAKVGSTAGVVRVSPPTFNRTRDTALFTAVPSTAPTDQRTKDLVQLIRSDRPAIESGTGATFLVSGLTAVNIDVAQKVQDSLVPYFGLVLVLAFLLLMVIFRSLLVPVKAVLGFLLSVLAALGAVVAVFQWGWGASLIGLRQTGPIISLMPIVLVGMIFGLAMDYEVFLVTRMREAHAHGERARQAIVSGFRHSARVVVAAALIMISVFSGFVGADLALIKMIGFGLAMAILFDAFVVRMALVPAVLTLLGERAWGLPRWLDRLLPKVDVEGRALDDRTAEPPSATELSNVAGHGSGDD